MTNLTDVTNDQLQALKDFASSENKVLVDKLEEILEDVAKTGQYIYPWHFMKPLYACKLDKVTSEFLSTSPPLNNDGTEDENEIMKLKEFRDKLLLMFDKFVCAPFTIQRVSEMLTNPRKHYKSTAKFFRGLEKNIVVVSTIDPVPSDMRPVLKRSLHDENPIERQNGFVDSELKPQMKKVHLEEKNEIGTHDSMEEQQKNGNSHELANIDCSIATSNTQIITNSAPNEGLENMLVCTESVISNNGGTNDSEKINDEQSVIDIAENIAETIAERIEEKIEDSIAESIAESIDEKIEDTIAENIAESIVGKIEDNIAENIAERMDEKLTDAIVDNIAERIEDHVAESIAENDVEKIDESAAEKIETPVKDEPASAEIPLAELPTEDLPVAEELPADNELERNETKPIDQS